jgi:hypothetical protein
VIKATLDGLLQLKDPAEVRRARGQAEPAPGAAGAA